jgi:hypothetical protein
MNKTATKEPKTKVMFRYWDKEVIAIFPEIPGDMDPYTCSSYMNQGQHGACDPLGIVHKSRPATPAEYKDLAEELTRRGYDLQIIHKLQYRFIDIRRKQIQSIDDSVCQECGKRGCKSSHD